MTGEASRHTAILVNSSQNIASGPSCLCILYDKAGKAVYTCEEDPDGIYVVKFTLE